MLTSTNSGRKKIKERKGKEKTQPIVYQDSNHVLSQYQPRLLSLQQPVQ
jgi:hypothetical protein